MIKWAPKVVLLKRLPFGYDTDLFIFNVNGKKVKRVFGNRYDNQQAINLVIKNIE